MLVKTKPCFGCGNSAVVEISETEFEAISSGIYVQDAMPTRSPEFRELFISGTHEHCWEAMFNSDDED